MVNRVVSVEVLEARVVSVVIVKSLIDNHASGTCGSPEKVPRPGKDRTAVRILDLRAAPAYKEETVYYGMAVTGGLYSLPMESKPQRGT